MGIMGIGGPISYHISFSLDLAGYLLISDLKTNAACMTPKVFKNWSLTFRESARNQSPTRESMR